MFVNTGPDHNGDDGEGGNEFGGKHWARITMMVVMEMMVMMLMMVVVVVMVMMTMAMMVLVVNTGPWSPLTAAGKVLKRQLVEAAAASGEHSAGKDFQLHFLIFDLHFFIFTMTFLDHIQP